MLSHGRTPLSHQDSLQLAMYKQTIPIPPCSLTNLHVFTAACSVLFSVFVLFLTYPTCSLYPPASYSFSSVFVAWSICSSSLFTWSILCCPTPSLFTMLTKTHSSVFSFPHQRLTLSQVFYSTLSRGSFPSPSFRFLAPSRKDSLCFR